MTSMTTTICISTSKWEIVLLRTPSEEMGLSLPASSVDGDIVMAHDTHLASTPSARASPPEDPLPLVIPGSQAQASPSSPDPQSTCSDVITNLDGADQHPKCTVRCQVLAVQGLTDNIEGCSAKYCEDPNWPGDMVLCSGVGCRSQVSLSIAAQLAHC
jgi:hypothetical protein